MTGLTVCATTAGMTTKRIEYVYDMFDRRIAKKLDPDNSGTFETAERYVYDGEHISLQFDGNGDLTHRYLHNPQIVDQILADEQLDPTTGALDHLYWPLTDNLGTVRDLAVYDDATGITAVANHRVFDSFGKMVSETDPSVDHAFDYTSRELDADTGLMYYRARWYDPAVGRFISEDPIGFAAGDANISRYVANNPLNFTDPSGLQQAPSWPPHSAPSGPWAAYPHSQQESPADKARRQIIQNRAGFENRVRSKVLGILGDVEKDVLGNKVTAADKRRAADGIARSYVGFVLEFLKSHPGAKPELGERTWLGETTGLQNAHNAPWCDDWAEALFNHMHKYLRTSGDGPFIRTERAQWNTSNPRPGIGAQVQHNWVVLFPIGCDSSGEQLSRPPLPLKPDARIVFLDPWYDLLPQAYSPAEHKDQSQIMVPVSLGQPCRLTPSSL